MSPLNALPTGTITFLFTDIEGSTKLWETQPAAMQAALKRHDALLHSAIGAAGGVVFKTVGDAFCAAFASAPAALEAAMAAQTALLAEPWPAETPLRARMALHTGTVEERDDDYFGPPLNRVARLLSAGHGGQTLLSIVTQELCRDTLPTTVSLRDLGSHRLKDLERPEHIYQANAPGLPNTFAPLKTLDNTPNNLPQQLTSFVGREKAIADVTALLSKTRLLTLTGSGGSGKTRLSLQVAADVLDAYPDGAWQVELAPLSDPSLVPQAVAFALSVKEQAGQSMTQTLASYLKDKTLLLLLDNCEHLLSACAQLTAALLRACPNARVLATSREPLNIAGEQTYRVPPLSLPNPQESKKATANTLSQFEAARLFIDRAQAVKAEFAVTNTNAPALAQLCFRLDGIPLALELAAARVRSLSVEQINDKLDSRFRILTGGDRSALPRQQTLRALVDWSYDLLTNTEQTVFSRLSIFAGGWTLEAAEAVCGFDPIDDWEVLDLLTSLADKSLIVADEAEGETRYRMLETLRQYGAEKRIASGDEIMQGRHVDFFIAFAEKANPELTGPEQARWLNLLETDNDNMRAALDALDTRSPLFSGAQAARSALLCVRLAGVLGQFWQIRGYFREGRERLAKALNAYQTRNSDTGATEAEQKESKNFVGRALRAAGFLARCEGDLAGVRSLYEESLVLARETGDTQSITSSLNQLGLAASDLGEYAAAQAFLEEAKVLCHAMGDKIGVGNALNNLSIIAFDRGNCVEAHALAKESLDNYRAAGDKRNCANALNNMANAASAAEDYVAARAALEEAVALYREVNSKFGIGHALVNLGVVTLQQEYYAAAGAFIAESLAFCREMGDKGTITNGLESMAWVCWGKENKAQAVTLWAATGVLREILGLKLPPGEQEISDAKIAEARTELGEEAFDAAWRAGRAMPWELAVDYALDTR